MTHFNFQFFAFLKTAVFLSLLFSFSSWSAPKAGQARAQNKKQKKEVIAPFRAFEAFRDSRPIQDRRARGLIIRYHSRPSLKQQKEVEGILKSSSLKKTKSIKAFKAELFGWTQGGLKSSKLGEKACDKLKNQSYVRRCRPDHLLALNESKKIRNLIKSQPSETKSLIERSKIESGGAQETTAGFDFECENCKVEELKNLGATAQKVLNLRTCNIVPHKRGLMKGELSDYWAQELIGSDLLREELKKTAPPETENWIAVFDSSKKDHNIAVKNLISDKGPHAVLPELEERKIPFLNIDSYPLKSGKKYKEALSLYETSYPGDYLFGFKKKAPSYINNSMAWFNSPDIYDAFKKLSSSKTSRSIIIAASGNQFPEKLDDMKKKASEDFDMILVGSLSHNGFVSRFSRSGKEVSILAPSDYQITSAGKKWDKEQFTGTSGAAPLVAGSLAGFEWLSGYHPTAKEAKILLEKTALTTLHSFEKPPINGAGLLNSYKLGEVAKRLKEKCKGKSISCFKQEILKDESYRFAKDKNLGRDLKRVFPSCFAGDSSELFAGGCEERKELFTRLRKEILLNSTGEHLKGLSCLYKESGFLRNEQALLSLTIEKESKLRANIKAMLLAEEEPVSEYLVRLALAMGGFEEDFNHDELAIGLEIAEGTEEAGLPLLELAYESGNLELQKKALASAEWAGEAALPLLERAYESGNLELQKKALAEVRWLGERALPFLEQGFKTGNMELQKEALDSAGWIGQEILESEEWTDSDSKEWVKKNLVPLLEEGFETGNLELQSWALSSAKRIKELGIPLLRRGFETGNLGLQSWAVYSANSSEKDLSLLEQAFESGNPGLQKIAVISAERSGRKAIPLLEKISKNPTLDEGIKWDIEKALIRLKKQGSQ